jgi:hypothetical protein
VLPVDNHLYHTGKQSIFVFVVWLSSPGSVPVEQTCCVPVDLENFTKFRVSLRNTIGVIYAPHVNKIFGHKILQRL